MVGPMIMPDSISPTTEGMFILAKSSPIIFEKPSIIARDRKSMIMSFPLKLFINYLLLDTVYEMDNVSIIIHYPSGLFLSFLNSVVQKLRFIEVNNRRKKWGFLWKMRKTGN